jgi:HlyD family secretion protein
MKSRFRYFTANVFSLPSVIVLFFMILFFSSCDNGRNKTDIFASGTIEVIQVDVSSKASGQVQKLLVEEGSRIKEGDALAVIDSSLLDIQLRQAEAGVEMAEAQVRLLQKGARPEDIHQAEEALKQVEATLKVAQEDVLRARDLFSKGSATQKQREDAEVRLAVVQAQENSTKELLNRVRQLFQPEEIKMAQARLNQAKAAADLLRKTIADCTIVAPVSGVVTHKLVEAGEVVGPGTKVLTISKLDQVYVMIYVTEKELGRVKLGQPAEVRIDAYPGRAFSGRVTFISPEAEFTPKNIQTKEDRVKLVFSLKIEIENPEGILKPGLPADATIKSDASGSK